MKNKICLIGMVVAMVLTFDAGRMLVLAEVSTAPCELYTQSDAEQLFKESLSPGVTRETMFPAGKSCRYSFNKNGGTYDLKLKLCESVAIKEEGINDSAADVMAHQKNARKANENAAKTFRDIPDLGDDAFWNGTDLWVLKGDTLIIITVNSFMEGSFKDMASANNAGMEQDLTLSQTIAKTILSRLK